MNVDVGPLKIKVDGNAFVFDLWRSTPVFHRWARPSRTACGLDLEPATALPPRLAARIGRPCTRCWPELARQPSLFSRRGDPGATRHDQEALIHGDA